MKDTLMSEMAVPSMTDAIVSWLRDHVGEVSPVHIDGTTGTRFLWWHEVAPFLEPHATRSQAEAQQLRYQLFEQPGAKEVIRVDPYGGRVRRKAHYPRKKQPRYRAKLGKWQRALLLWLFEWDEDFQGRVNDIWPRGITVEMRLKHVVGQGIVWRPRLMAGQAGKPWTPQARASVARALQHLERRGLVERIPYGTSSRTKRVRVTTRGLKLLKSMTNPHTVMNPRRKR
jgi:hypothetical protein